MNMPELEAAGRLGHLRPHPAESLPAQLHQQAQEEALRHRDQGHRHWGSSQRHPHAEDLAEHQQDQEPEEGAAEATAAGVQPAQVLIPTPNPTRTQLQSNDKIQESLRKTSVPHNDDLNRQRDKAKAKIPTAFKPKTVNKTPDKQFHQTLTTNPQKYKKK